MKSTFNEGVFSNGEHLRYPVLEQGVRESSKLEFNSKKMINLQKSVSCFKPNLETEAPD